MPNRFFERATLRRNAVLVASMLFMTIGTGSIYFLVVALKLVSAEFEWPRAVPSVAYSLQYFGAGIGGIFMGYILDRTGLGIPALLGARMMASGCGGFCRRTRTKGSIVASANTPYQKDVWRQPIASKKY